MQMPPTIFVVDDDAAVRDSLAELGRSMGYPVRGFASANDFLDAIGPDQPGCIVLDVRMPGMSGLELQETVAGRGNPLPVIIVTGHGDIPMSVCAIKAGAVDFLEKPFSPDKLVRSIQSALDLDVRRRENKRHRDAVGGQLAQLTDDERSVLRGVADGKTNGVIAEELDVSLRTVQFRRANIKKKLRVDSKSEMILLARQAMFANVAAGENNAAVMKRRQVS
jgi:two-component system response regulator FixJ